jgi:Cu2+-exporting ATPase
MTHLCKHCATPYPEGSGVDGFCCAGCQQVYYLIKNEGLDDFYRWQDRAAQPLKDRSLAAVDVAALQRAQQFLEQSGVSSSEHEIVVGTFQVEGMSCMGCAWLIERLCTNQYELDEARVSLASHLLHLKWKRGSGFDLVALGTDLIRFGYRLDPKPRQDVEESRISPLALRVLLSAVFTANSLLLAVYQEWVGHSDAHVGMVDLLSLVCVCFTFMLGAAPFFLSVYRASKIRRWHSDWGAVIAMLFSLSAVYYFGLSQGAFLMSLFVFILILARWIGVRLHRR